MERLPAGNLVSLVMATEGMIGPVEAADVLEKALRLLSSANRHQLGETFLSWFRLLLGRAGVDLDFLEDRAMMARMAESGELRTALEERFRALHDAYRAEGVERGLERERRLLVRQIERKFGTEVAEPVARLLAGIGDPDRLQDVGEWIVDCDAGNELLARLEEAAEPVQSHGGGLSRVQSRLDGQTAGQRLNRTVRLSAQPDLGLVSIHLLLGRSQEIDL